MPTDRQIAANRRNARRSTGPRSAAGRKRSSRNSHRHGLAAGVTATANILNDWLARSPAPALMFAAVCSHCGPYWTRDWTIDHLALDCAHCRGLTDAVRRCVSVGSGIETARCSIGLAAAVDRHDLGVSYERRRIGRRIFLSSRHSLESRIFLDRQCSMENIALNHSGAI